MKITSEAALHALVTAGIVGGLVIAQGYCAFDPHPIFSSSDFSWPSILAIPAGLAGLASALLWIKGAFVANGEGSNVNAAAGCLSGAAVALTLGTTSISPGKIAPVFTVTLPWLGALGGLAILVALAWVLSPWAERRRLRASTSSIGAAATDTAPANHVTLLPAAQLPASQPGVEPPDA